MTDDVRLVSVIMPAFNTAAFVAAAVESVLAQDIAGLELIVVEDGSSDQTASVLSRYAHRAEVRILSHPGNANRGVCASRRLALSEARGEFVAFLDADDRYRPEKLRRHIAFLREHPEVVLVHGTIGVEGTAAQATELEGWFTLDRESVTYRLAELPSFLESNRICNSTVVCRRSAIKADDLPPSMVFQYEDWVLWTLLGGRGVFRYDAQPLTAYRYHPASFTHRCAKSPGLAELAHIEYLTIVVEKLSDRPARRRAGRLLMSDLLRLASLRTPGLDRGTESRFSLRLLNSIVVAALRDWFRRRLRACWGGRNFRPFKRDK